MEISFPLSYSAEVEQRGKSVEKFIVPLKRSCREREKREEKGPGSEGRCEQRRGRHRRTLRRAPRPERADGGSPACHSWRRCRRSCGSGQCRQRDRWRRKW